MTTIKVVIPPKFKGEMQGKQYDDWYNSSVPDETRSFVREIAENHCQWNDPGYDEMPEFWIHLMEQSIYGTLCDLTRNGHLNIKLEKQ